MFRYLSILLLTVVLFLASCEDKEKSRNNTTTSPATSEYTGEDSVMEIEADEPLAEEDEEVEEEQWQEGPMLEQEELIPFLTEYGEENPENRIKITTRFGEIEVLLYRDTPLHRANFIFLTNEGYFDGTFFHRVVEDFVIQGGNSDNPETARKRTKIGSFLIPSEFEAGHRHTRGAFAAAKYSEQNVSKASSPFEFYIVHSDRGAHHLDNDHTVYGRVISGMDVVDEIARQDVEDDEWPMTNIHIEVDIVE